MRPLITANVEYLEYMPMFVANLYGEDGYLIDQLVLRHVDIAYSLLRAGDMAEQAGCSSVELWTRDPNIFKEALQMTGFAARIKHPEDTKDTQQLIEQHRDILLELYADDIKSEKQLPPAGRFRKWVVFLLQRILDKLGADKYDYGV